MIERLREILPDLFLYKAGEEISVPEAMCVVGTSCPGLHITRPALSKCIQEVFSEAILLHKRIGSQKGDIDLQKRLYPFYMINLTISSVSPPNATFSLY